MKLSRSAFGTAAIALYACGALAAPLGSALLQAPAAEPDNYGTAVVTMGGALYGTLGDGIYSVTPPAGGSGAWTSKVFSHAYTTGNATTPDGYEFAEGRLTVGSNGALYAATQLNLEGGGGVIMYTPSATTGSGKTVLWSFAPGAIGASVNAGMVVDASGAVYGTTRGGSMLACAPGCGFGSVFKLTPPAKGKTGWTASILYSFTGKNDGDHPDGALSIDASGALYGTAGGGAHNAGVVFKLTPGSGSAPWTATTLYSFTGAADGSLPTGGVTADASGNLYGVTSGCAGAAACVTMGSVYRLAKPASAGGAWTFATLAGGLAFPSYQGSLTIDSAGKVYGSSGYQCTTGAVSCGVVFSLTPPKSGSTWSYTQLYDVGQSGMPGTLAAAGGVVYGTAEDGTGCTTSAGGCMTVMALSGTGFAN